MGDNHFLDHFHALTASSKDPHLLLTRDGVVAAVNSSAAAFLKSNEEELHNAPLTSLVSDSVGVVSRGLKSCGRTTSPTPVKLSWKINEGHTVRLRSLGRRLHLESIPEEDYLLIQVVLQESSSDKFFALNKILGELRVSKNMLVDESEQLEEEVRAHQQAEEALAESNTRLTTILDGMDSVVYVADMKTYELLFLNRSGREIFGDVTGKLCWETLQEGQSGPCDFCSNKYLLARDGSPARTYSWEHKNPRTGRWYYLQDRAIRWSDGRLVRIEIASDINDRKEAEHSLKRTQERLEALWHLNQLEASSEQELADYAVEEAVRLSRSKAGYLHFLLEDEKTIEMFSWSKSVDDGLSGARLTHYPLERAGIWADAARSRKPVIQNDYQDDPDRKGYPEGHFHVLRHMGVPIIDNDKIVAIVGVANKETPYDETDVRQLALFMNSMWNILKRKRTELAVRGAKEEWESTFDAIDEIVTIHDPEMRIIRANKAASELLNLHPREMIGKHCFAVFRNAAEPCKGCPEIRALRYHRTYRGEMHYENLGKTFEISSSPIMNEEELCTGAVHIAKDITEQKKLEEQLNRAQKMEAIGTLAGGIAHDFNNILGPIIGFTDLALEKIPPGSTLAKDLGQVVKAGNRAKELVREILSFSRESAHERQPLSPHLIVKEALKLLRSSLPTTIKIAQDIPNDCGTILADPTHLHQIVMNLCTNAYHAMRDTGGVMTVKLSQSTLEETDDEVVAGELMAGNYIRLEVRDTGHGMDRQTLERAFDPYFTTKTKGEGTGLGLAVVHGLVKSHEGYITVSSEPGHGTTFSIYFPRVEKMSGMEREIEPGPLPKGKERIMVIDDERPIAQLEELMLQSLGYEVNSYTSSEEALDAFLSRPEEFDLIVTDMTMPQKTGLDLAKEVLAARPGLPVIICSGYSDLIDEETAKRVGISRYLMKPVTNADFAAAVREALDRRT